MKSPALLTLFALLTPCPVLGGAPKVEVSEPHLWGDRLTLEMKLTPAKGELLAHAEVTTPPALSNKIGERREAERVLSFINEWPYMSFWWKNIEPGTWQFSTTLRVTTAKRAHMAGKHEAYAGRESTFTVEGIPFCVNSETDKEKVQACREGAVGGCGAWSKEAIQKAIEDSKHLDPEKVVWISFPTSAAGKIQRITMNGCKAESVSRNSERTIWYHDFNQKQQGVTIYVYTYDQTKTFEIPVSKEIQLKAGKD